MIAHHSDITLGEDIAASDSHSNASLDDESSMTQAHMVASTPMVMVKKETVNEVTGGENGAFSPVNKILFEVTATEEGGPVVKNNDQIEVGEIRRGRRSCLSETHIEEVGGASDESWLLTGTDPAGEIFYDNSIGQIKTPKGSLRT